MVALVDGENKRITHTSQIDKAKPVGDKYRWVVHYNITTQDQVPVELCCVRRKVVACRIFNDSVRIRRTEWKLRSRLSWDDNIRVEPPGSCI